MAPHPLRRPSTGSLTSLARSQDRNQTSSSGLDFLIPALTELSDEASTLSTNISRLNELHDALGTFNEAFAGWMFALKMNAFCVEWPLAPDGNSIARMEVLNRPPTPPLLSIPIQQTTSEGGQVSDVPPQNSNQADMTYVTSHSFSTDDTPTRPAPQKVVAAKKGVVGGGVAAKKAAVEKKRKRDAEIAVIIETLPLEYRGRDMAVKLCMEQVISKLMDHPSGLPIKDIVGGPDMPHPKVNKCLISLVAKKLVTKVIIEKSTWYKWVGA